MKAHASFNRFYRLLWSGTTQQWKPVPETARTAKKGGRGKAANTLTLAGVFPGVAMSLFVMSNLAAQPPPQPPAPAATQLPTGGAVVGGQATISQSAIATAANMVVNQSSQRAIIDWSSFNLGSAATVQFVQPNAQSVILNRVLDPNPSQIFGRISANGQVFLTNPYGVYFSPTATVDVGGLVATTYDIRNADFMSGYYKFERVGGSGRIVNEGALRATAGGYIALLAPEVQNSGVVLARAGTVAMAAGDEVTLTIADGKSLSGITTTASAIASLIENKLAVQAPDGQIILSAVAVNKLQAGVIKNSGSLQATSMTAKGGKIVLEGDEIELTGTATVDVSGRTGGGTVLMGGDWQGSGTMRQATKVTMAANSTISASATDNGDGGKVVLWSNVSDANSQTVVHGSIKADAGPNGGKGGQIETSGYDLNVDDIQVSTQAPRGAIGEWLLDPANVNIVNGANVNSTESAGVYSPNATATTVNISNVTLANALANTSVTVTTSGSSAASAGDINIAANISWGSSSVLTLNANNSVIGAGNISMTGGGGVVFNTANTTSTAAYSGVISGNGSLTKQGLGILTLSGNSTFSGNIAVNAGTLKSGLAGTINAGAFGKNATITLADVAGVTIDVSGNSTFMGSLSGSANTTLNVGSSSASIGTNNASTTFAGQITGSGYLAKYGTGTLTLPGNSSGLRGVTVSDGRLILTNTSVISNSSSAIALNTATAVLELQNVTTLSNPLCLSNAGTVLISSGNTNLTGTLNLSGNANKSFNVSAGSSLTLSGNITTGNNQLIKKGLGTLAFQEPPSGVSQTFSQGLNVTEGRVIMNTTQGVFGQSLTSYVSPGATLEIQKSAQNTAGFYSGSAIVNNGTIVVNESNASFSTLFANISGTGSVEFIGSSVVNFLVGGSYTGGTTIRAGSGLYGSLTSFGDANTSIVNHGLLRLTAGNYDFAQNITGTGRVEISNADLTRIYNIGIKGENTYTGGTNISFNGSVVLGGNATTGASGSLGPGNISLNANVSTLEIRNTGGLTFGNNISGVGNFAANASGTVVLTGVNNYTGSTTIANNRSLTIDATSTWGSNGNYSGAIVFGTNATLDYAGAGDLNLTGNLTQAIATTGGVLRKSTSTSNLTLTGNNSYTGGTFIDAGTVYALGSTSTTGRLGTGNITVNNSLVINRSGAFSLSGFSGNIAGTGNVTILSRDNNVTIDRNITLTGDTSLIKVMAGSNLAAGNVTGNVTLSNNISTGTNGTIVLFAGAPTTINTTTLLGKMAGASGALKYKTYNATLSSLGNAVAGTRNFFYRNQPSATLTGGTVTAVKVYDGTTTANATYTGSGAATGIDGDSLTGAVLSANYNSSSAGSKTLNVSLAITSNTAGWALAGYNGTISGASTTATITKAPLTVKANDDARFVTFSDTVGYTGASYSGFVNNETLATSGLTGTLAIARSSASNAAGTYALTPSGLSANNYNITFANGTYTIVPAQQLIVRVNDGTSVYGNTPNLTVASANYLMPDNLTIVNLTGNLSVSNAGLYSLQDGASGSASFNLGLVNATMSTANRAAVGVWNVGYSNLNKVGVNFNNMTVVGTQTITPRTLNITATATNKEYDGNTNASVLLTKNLLGSDVVNTTADTSGLFADKNAGNGKTVTVSNISISGGADAGNYILGSKVATTTANITPKALSLAGLTATDKVYDGTTNATVAFTSFTGLVGLDDVQVANTGTFSDKNVGTGKTVTVSGLALSGADAGNYQLSSATTTASITPKTLNISGLSAVASKVYDGKTTASPLGTASLLALEAPGTGTSSDGKAFTGDVVSLSGTPTGTYNSKDVATAANVTLGGLTLTGAQAGNYVLAMPSPITANITPAPLVVRANDDANFVLVSNAAGYAGASYSGFVNNENATSTGFASALSISRSDSANVSAGTYTLTPSGLTSTNYNVSYQTGTYTIVPAQTLLIRVSNDSSVYGSTANMNVTSASYLMSDNTTIVNLTNNLSLSSGLYTVQDGASGAATFNLGLTNVTLSQSGRTAVGIWNVGYSNLNKVGVNFNNMTVIGTQTVTAKAINITATAANKEYDGNTNATMTLSSADAISGDTISYAYSNANFISKNVGTNKTATATNLTIRGDDATNYAIQNLVAEATANITAKTLNVSGITATNKVYDGNTAAAINTSGVTNATLVSGGMVAGDNVVVSATGSFADKNVNSSILVTLSSTYSGADAGNYNFNAQANTTANITAKALNITGITADNKVYDGNTSATINISGVTNATLVSGGLVAGDNVTVSATGTFADKNANTSILVTLNSTYGGADASNYNITSQANTTANITAKAVTLTAPQVTRAYDGTANYSALAADLTALSSQLGIVGDSVTGITLAYLDKNVGTNKTVTAIGATLSDGNNGLNYNLSYAFSSLSSITRKAITLSGITADNKVYDGTTTATVNTSGVTNATWVTAGMISGDTLTVSATGTFADKNVGTSKVVTLNSTYGGADAGNYNITSQVNTTADITPKSLTVTGLSAPSSKVYDGTTTATLLTTGQLQSASSPGAGNSTDGKPYTGDTVNLAGTPTGNYNSKDVATAANLSISGLSLSGSAAGNYVLTSPTPIAATITPAPLVVRANDDARFVTLSDTAGYAGVSYNGFVNSETLATSGVTGALAIARSDSANGAAGSYALTPSGLMASNYNLSYQTGTYTIVPAQTLLIRVGSTSTLYGNAMSLNVTNASYLMSDNVTIVNLTSSLSVSNGLYTLQDGASGSASFNLGVSNVTMSGSGHVPVGIWNVGTSNLTKTSSNFVTLAAVGTQTVTAKSITVSATAANKVYDGNTNATVTLSSADVLTGDAISYGFSTASFASNSVEANKSVAITNISLAGGDAQNYRLQNLMVTATADITAASNSNSGGGGGGGGSYSTSDDLLTSQRALAVTTQASERAAPTRVVTRPESRSSADLLQTPPITRASASGVLPVAVIEDNRMSNLGMTYEQQSNDIRIQLTTAPAITPPPNMLRFSGNFKTFWVVNDQGEVVSYQGAVIGKRLVILADTASAKRLARVDMQTVLAAAITTLGADQPISLAELESVVMDLR